MEEKKTVFDYLGQVLTLFGFSMMLMNLFCMLFGDAAKEVSSMFDLGNEGISTATACQFFCISALISALRYLFFTDILFRNMPIWLRTLCMLISVVFVCVTFVVAFGWFPVTMWQPWAMFAVCFVVSFIGSCAVVVIKERMENKRMEEALQRLKEKKEDKKQ